MLSKEIRAETLSWEQTHRTRIRVLDRARLLVSAMLPNYGVGFKSVTVGVLVCVTHAAERTQPILSYILLFIIL